MLRYNLRVSKAELALLSTIRSLRFGEIFSIEVAEQQVDETALNLSQNAIDLLELIRDGTQHIDVLTVHEGEPVLAEIDYQTQGFRCRKRIKFPTTKTEG